MNRAAASLALALSLSTTFARAAEPTDAKGRFADGMAAFGEKDYAAAAAAFADVYKVTGATKHLWNLALAEYEAHRAYPALSHLREYLAKPDVNPKNVPRANKLIGELAPKVGRVRVTAPEGAEVLVDDRVVGVAPIAAPVEVDPDQTHSIVARRGADRAKQDVSAIGPAEVAVSLAFPVAAAPSPPPAVVAPPAAIAPSPPPATDQSPARTESTSLAHRSGALRTWMTVGLGAGALALAGGGVFMAIQSSNDQSDADRIRSGMQPNACRDPNAAGCAQLQDALSSQSTHHTLSLVFYGGAGALAIGAVASFLLLPRGEPSPKSGAFVPVVGPQMAGAGYLGVF